MAFRPVTELEELVIGVDIGGTKICTGIVDSRGNIVSTMTRPTPKNSYVRLLHCIEGMLHEIVMGIDLEHIKAIGIAVPGVVDMSTKAILWVPNLMKINGTHLASDVEKILGKPAWIIHDGHAVALAELWIGAGRFCRNFITVAIGTGLGGGVVADGRLLTGAHGIAGGLGWMALDASPELGITSLESSVGWLEAHVAGPAIEREALNEAFGSISELFAMAEAGVPSAVALTRRLGNLLGTAISNVASFLDTEAVVLTGGVGSNGKSLIPYIYESIKLKAQPYVRDRLHVVVSSLGRTSGMVGSAKFAWDSQT